jgi:hypothetical protein
MRRRIQIVWAGVRFGLSLVFMGAISALPGGEPPGEIAREVDRRLQAEIQVASPVPRVDDEVFLRRAYLDTVGQLPTPREITAFVLDPDEDKRSKVVEKLLADERFGRNWSRYWRDVILYRKTEERAQIIAAPLAEYFETQLNANAPWSKIATDIITATGDATENGACGLIIAQQGQPEETVAEISRIFLGVQIACAQCHDHPTDRWKREEFHQLAAFFPRVASRVILTPENRSINVVANDFFPFRGRAMGNMRFRGTAEHFMSDLKNPQSAGTRMEPVLFATGDKLPIGAKDSERRGKLAEWITKPENPYFAKALVNRLWGELCGEGFYEPLDDIGPDRQCTAPQTLDYLAGEFAKTGYDVKWLYRTILATDLYQKESRDRRNPDQPAFQANVAQRLRADQLFDNLLAALGVPEPTGGMRRGMGGAGARYGFGGPRFQFAFVFGHDPSERKDELVGSIPQALALMNSPSVNGALKANGFTELARVARSISDDRALVMELYLRTLAREPKESELATCLAYFKEVGNRTEAIEDLQWSLLNSTEFLHRK